MLKSERDLSLDEVAVELGVTRERVRQIEAKALGKLRDYCAERRIGFDDLLPADTPDDPTEDRHLRAGMPPDAV